MAKPEKVAVKMLDGRTVEFGKRQKLAKDVLFENGIATGVRFDLLNGKTLTIHAADVPEKIQAHLACHGISQKCGDECADLDDVGDMFEAIRGMITRLVRGDWTAERTGFSGATILIKALVEVYGKTEEEVRKILEALKPAERNALKQVPEVLAVVQRLEKEKAASVDVSGIIGKLAA